MAEQGFCYVVDTAGYRDEALRSASSLRRRMPHAAIAMVTHRELFLEGTPVTDWKELPPGREGPIVKTSAILAPYEKVVILDSDTYVAGDLSELFDILDAYDLAAALDVTRPYDYGLDIPHAFPELNTGVVGFRKSEAMRRFFLAWEDFDRELCRDLGIRILNDQTSFRAALWRSPEVRHCALTPEFNFLAACAGFVAGEVRIVHARTDRGDKLANELNRVGGPRAFIPGAGVIQGFRGRRHWVRQWLALVSRAANLFFSPSRLTGKPAPVDWAAESEDEAAQQRRGVIG